MTNLVLVNLVKFDPINRDPIKRRSLYKQNRSKNVYLKIRSYNTIGFKSGEGDKNEPKKNKNGGRQNLDGSRSSQFGSHLGGSSSDEEYQNCNQGFDAKHGDGKSETANRNLERLSLGCPVAGSNCP
jgi:hypothetical protein